MDKSAAETLNNRTIEYQMARQEADQSRLLYEDLLKHLEESGLLAGLRSTNISIVDPGRPADKPAKLVTLLYLFGSLVAGLFVGSATALLRNLTNTKVQDVQEISRELGATPLCVLPYQKERTGMPAGLNRIASSPLMMLPAVDNPRSVFVESLRSLRTSLMMSRSGSPPRIVLVTSPLPGEGKSFISWNLAILLAQQGKRVLLCDADLRRPRLHRDMQIDTQLGLSTVLTGLSDDHGARIGSHDDSQLRAVEWYLAIVILTLIYNLDESFLFEPRHLGSLMFVLACVGLKLERLRLQSSPANRIARPRLSTVHPA